MIYIQDIDKKSPVKIEKPKIMEFSMNKKKSSIEKIIKLS